MNEFKNLFNQDNKTILIGLLSILIGLWSILYIIPGFLSSLFNTILGNLILLISLILVSSQDIKYGIALTILFVVLYRFSHLKEGFTWSDDSIKKFIEVQDTINPHVIFDTVQIQKQASQEELDYFLKNGIWPWSQQVQELYKLAIMKNPYVRTNPEDSINEARKIYNQTIILEMLSWQTKEGKFLLNGIEIDNSENQERDGAGSYAFKSGLISRAVNGDSSLIKCGLNSNGDNVLQQTKYKGNEGIFGSHIKDVTDLDYNNLENIIPGFKFVNEKCNPCVAINSPPVYSCPFILDMTSENSNHQGKISTIWQYLWGLDTDPLQSNPSTVTSENNIDPNKFPILNEIKTELDNLFVKEEEEQK
jgi:hypothetical protein